MLILFYNQKPKHRQQDYRFILQQIVFALRDIGRFSLSARIDSLIVIVS